MADKENIDPFTTARIQLPKELDIAVLPLQNTTLFPETVVPLAVGRERSTRAVESALATEEKLLACLTDKDGKRDRRRRKTDRPLSKSARS